MNIVFVCGHDERQKLTFGLGKGKAKTLRENPYNFPSVTPQQRPLAASELRAACSRESPPCTCKCISVKNFLKALFTQ